MKKLNHVNQCKKKEDISSPSRREFLKTLSGAAATALLAACTPGGNDSNDNGGTQPPQTYGPRTGKSNPFVTADGRPVLVCVDGVNFYQMLVAGLQAIGGLDRLIGANEDVFINPNCNHVDPYPGISSAASIADIVTEIKRVTAGTVSVGDSGYEAPADVYGSMGLRSAVENAGGTLVTLGETYNTRYSDWSPTKPFFKVYSDIYDAPVLVSTCVIKRHSWASLTCAIKNNVGTVAGPGASSTRDYIHYTSENFMKELAEIASLVNPDLVIVDARSILIRRGPMISDGGTIVDVGKVIISGDIVAADVYCGRIMEENDSTFSLSLIQDTLQQAEERGLGTSDLNQVEIIEITA